MLLKRLLTFATKSIYYNCERMHSHFGLYNLYWEINEIGDFQYWKVYVEFILSWILSNKFKYTLYNLQKCLISMLFKLLYFIRKALARVEGGEVGAEARKSRNVFIHMFLF